MKFLTLVLTLITIAVCCVSETFCLADEPAADFFVATNGSDDWSGTLAAPNSQATDGPFATLERARDAVRKLDNRSKDVLVLVRGGTYPIDKTIVFGLEDSGKGDSTVTYAAYPDETPIFSAGRGRRLETSHHSTTRLASQGRWQSASSNRVWTIPSPVRRRWIASTGSIQRFFSNQRQHSEQAALS